MFISGNSIPQRQKENLSIFCDAIKFLVNKFFLTNIIENEDIVSSVKKYRGRRVKRKNLQTVNKNSKKIR